MEIHIQLAGVELGPYSEKQVRSYLEDGLLSLTDPARFEGNEKWETVTDILAAIAAPVVPPAPTPEKTAPATIPPQEPISTPAPPSPPSEVRKAPAPATMPPSGANLTSKDTIRVPLPQIAEALAKQTAVRKAIPSTAGATIPKPKSSEKARTSLLTAVNLLAKRTDPAFKETAPGDVADASKASQPPTAPVTFPRTVESVQTMPMSMGKMIVKKSDQEEKPMPAEPAPMVAKVPGPRVDAAKENDLKRTSLLSAVRVLAKKADADQKPSDDAPILPKAPSSSGTSLPSSKSPQNLRTAPMSVVRAIPRKKEEEANLTPEPSSSETELGPEVQPTEPSVPTTALRFVPPEGDVGSAEPGAVPTGAPEEVSPPKSLRRRTGSLPNLVKALERKPGEETPAGTDVPGSAETVPSLETSGEAILEQAAAQTSPSPLSIWFRSFAQKIGLWKSTEPSLPEEPSEIPITEKEVVEPTEKSSELPVEKVETTTKAPEPVDVKADSVVKIDEPAGTVREPVSSAPELVSARAESVPKAEEAASKVHEPVTKAPEPVIEIAEPVKQLTPEAKELEPAVTIHAPVVKAPEPIEPLSEVKPPTEATSDQPAESSEPVSPAKSTKLSRATIIALGIFVALIAVGAIVFSYFNASSVAAAALLKALKDGDQAQLEKVVDFPSVRQSLKDEVATQLAKPGISHPAGNSDPAVVLAMIKNSIDRYVTPEALSALATKSDKIPKAGSNPTLLPASAAAILDGLNNLPVKSQSLVAYNLYVIDLDAAKLDLQSSGSGWKLYRIELKNDFPMPTEPGATGAPADLGSSLSVPVVETYLQEGKAKFEQAEKDGDKADWDGVIAPFTQVLALDPKQVVAYSNRAMAKAQKADLEGKNGDFNGKKNDLDGAIADFTQALSLDPRLAEAYYNRGDAKADQGDVDGALADYTQAANLDPKMGMAFYKRGGIRAVKGDYDGAIADFTQEIADDPSFANAYSNRGFVRQAQKDLDGAIADYTQALAINPKLATTYYNRAFAKEAKADLDGAILDYSHALDIDPKMTRAYYNRGIAKNTKNDLDGALADYNQALTLDPQLAPALADRALVKQAKGDLKGALDDLNHALSIDPKIPDAYYSRGLIEEQLNDLDGAINDSTRAIDLDPKRAQAYYNRGFAKLVKGNLDGARTDLQKFCELAPRDPYADHAQLYLWLIGMAQNPTGTANQDLSDALQNSWSLGPDDLVTKIAAFLLDRTSESDLISSANSMNQRKDQGQHCEVWYFAGMKRLLAGDKTTAIDYFRKCLATGQKDYCEYILAQAELQVLAPTP